MLKTYWHDLRKDNTDLPKKTGMLCIIAIEHTNAFGDIVLSYKVDRFDAEEHNDFIIYRRGGYNVVAWAESEDFEY